MKLSKSDIINKKVHIFDMDGTLLNLEELNFSGYNETVKHFFNKELTNAEYQKFFSGTKTYLAFKIYCESISANSDIDELIYYFRDIKRTALMSENLILYVKEIDGAMRYLSKLKAEGRILILATSTIKEFADRLLQSQGMLTYFDHVLTAEDVKKGKPDPEIYNKAFSLGGNAKEDTVVYEDSKNGIQAGIAANIDVVGVLTKELNDEFVKSADYVIESYKKLI